MKFSVEFALNWQHLYPRLISKILWSMFVHVGVGWSVLIMLVQLYSSIKGNISGLSGSVQVY